MKHKVANSYKKVIPPENLSGLFVAGSIDEADFRKLWEKMLTFDRSCFEYIEKILPRAAAGEFFVIEVTYPLSVNVYNSAIIMMGQMLGLNEKIAVRAQEVIRVILVGPNPEYKEPAPEEPGVAPVAEPEIIPESVPEMVTVEDEGEN